MQQLLIFVDAGVLYLFLHRDCERYISEASVIFLVKSEVFDILVIPCIFC